MKAAMQMNPNQSQNLAKFDPVPEISRKHFEEALKAARKSVTNMVSAMRSQLCRTSTNSSSSAGSSTLPS